MEDHLIKYQNNNEIDENNENNVHISADYLFNNEAALVINSSQKSTQPKESNKNAQEENINANSSQNINDSEGNNILYPNLSEENNQNMNNNNENGNSNQIQNIINDHSENLSNRARNMTDNQILNSGNQLLSNTRKLDSDNNLDERVPTDFEYYFNQENRLLNNLPFNDMQNNQTRSNSRDNHNQDSQAEEIQVLDLI